MVFFVVCIDFYGRKVYIVMFTFIFVCSFKWLSDNVVGIWFVTLLCEFVVFVLGEGFVYFNIIVYGEE